MLDFCTLFDSNYLSRGLAMYESLKARCADFHLYIYAFDDKSEDLLVRLDLENVTIVGLSDFEDEGLLRVKPQRTKAEYCWTCTPSVILHAIETYGLGRCTYIDADLYFYAPPEELLSELGDGSVQITAHRYFPSYDGSATSGIYCVQFTTFRNDTRGMRVLKWWRDACIEWCYDRFEDGKFGDQKYLDDWCERFEGVRVLAHKGGGVAPWNVCGYEVCKKGDEFWCREVSTGEEFRLIFYHFHGMKFYTDGVVRLTYEYELSKEVKNLLYSPYLRHLEDMARRVSVLDDSFDPHGSSSETRGAVNFLKRLIRGKPGHLYRKDRL